MNIAIDIGNTRVKVGYFHDGNLVAMTAHVHAEYPDAVLASEAWKTYSPQSKYLGMVSVGNPEMVTATYRLVAQQPGLELQHIDRSTDLPIGNQYGSPRTLGMDRICGAVAGYQRAGHGHVLVVGAGTALTFDYVDVHGDYLGGAISLGLRSRFRALHEFTAALPLLGPEGELPWIGNDTATSIRSGVVHGIISEIEGFVAHYRTLETQPLTVFLTGGDAEFLGNLTKSITFVDSNLLLYGINTLIRYHA